jgi:hypothetical protein
LAPTADHIADETFAQQQRFSQRIRRIGSLPYDDCFSPEKAIQHIDRLRIWFRAETIGGQSRPPQPPITNHDSTCQEEPSFSLVHMLVADLMIMHSGWMREAVKAPGEKGQL